MASKIPRPVQKLEDAFIVIPDGPYPYDGLQILGYFLIIFFPLLSLTVCGLRVHSRRLSKGFGWDDWLIFLAMALALVQAVLTSFVLKSGYWGIRDSDVPNHPENQGSFWIFINGIVYNPLLALVKVSALIFLLRLGGTKTRVRITCRAMIWFNVLQLSSYFPAAILQCIPIQTPWTTTPGGKCIERDIYSLALAVTNIVTDVLTLLIPFWIFLDLKVNKKIRNALLIVFTLGTVVTIISIVRLYYIIRLYYLSPDDRHYSLGYITSNMEINLAIVTASVPALWPLARRWFPGVFESLGIDRPYLYPDIEVGYATQQSRAGGALQVKVSWQKRKHVPSGAAVEGPGAAVEGVMGTNGAGAGAGAGGRGCVPADIRGQPVYFGSGGGRGRRWDEDGDGDAMEMEYDDSFLKVDGGSQGSSDRGLRTSLRGI
ncbi:hypothetical protein B0T25DRAFT_596600 [Lasiosphaeria hispida]|uniref:Rhodopsin domain-containing protein n=1 Tax=Lasiosphaeria hispida TaxID=260671 RepID=A0AAJ0HVC9_9PEZI|nr:hypothetical protein B0T25DRAFT_596600 [Lasiosphaeria hispida]